MSTNGMQARRLSRLMPSGTKTGSGVATWTCRAYTQCIFSEVR
jgi:hypothetical protein